MYELMSYSDVILFLERLKSGQTFRVVFEKKDGTISDKECISDKPVHWQDFIDPSSKAVYRVANGGWTSFYTDKVYRLLVT